MAPRSSVAATMAAFRNNEEGMFALNDPATTAANDSHLSPATVIRDFVGFTRDQAEQNGENPADIDFNTMSDEELFRNLQDFLGSGQANTNFNGTLIEDSQRAVEQMLSSMFGDDTDENENDSPEVKDRKRLTRFRERAQEEQKRQQEEIAERTAEWNAGNAEVSIGGTKLGSRLVDAIIKAWKDPKQKEKLIEKYSKEQNIPTKQAEKELDVAVKILEITKKKALNPNAPLTKEEEELYKKKDDPKYAPAIKFLEKSEKNGFENSLNYSGQEERISSGSNEISTKTRAQAFREDSEVPEGQRDYSFTTFAPSLIKTDISPQAEFNRNAAPNAAPAKEPAAPKERNMGSALSVEQTTSFGFSS